MSRTIEAKESLSSNRYSNKSKRDLLELTFTILMLILKFRGF